MSPLGYQLMHTRVSWPAEMIPFMACRNFPAVQAVGRVAGICWSRQITVLDRGYPKRRPTIVHDAFRLLG